MKQSHQGLIAVAGNVYFCKFRAPPGDDAGCLALAGVVADIRRAAAVMQSALREIDDALEKLHGNDGQAAGAVMELARAVGEIAFYAHIAAAECERGDTPLPQAQEIRQLTLAGAAVAHELHSWAMLSLGRTQNAARELMEIAARVHGMAGAFRQRIWQYEPPGTPGH